MKKFIEQHASKIVGVLSCFDRIIFKGHLPFSYASGFEAFLSYHGILFKDFANFVSKHAAKITEHAKQAAQKNGRPYLYFNGHVRKEEIARSIAKRDKIANGLVCIIAVVEPCNSFVLRPGAGRPHLEAARRKCLCIYFYFIDRDFGFIHIRIQTWFPLTIQVYINGHEWLAKKMDRHGISYKKIENAFVDISDFNRAQQFANNMGNQNWPRVLEALARKVNPLLKGLLKGCRHYWVIDQAEYSTDVVFQSRASLKPLYEELLKHATLCFGAEDVLTFLGRKLCGQFNGEVLTEFKDRWPGARVKHHMKRNWIKMYDKHGSMVRVETVINDAKEFKVRRMGTVNGERKLAWFPMCKGVKNFRRYAQVSLAANKRYLDALAVVDDPKAAFDVLDKVCMSKKEHGRSVRGFNPISIEDVSLFGALLRGEHVLNGFQNKHIRSHLFVQKSPAHRYGSAGGSEPADARRQSARMSRILNRLHAYGLIARIPRSRRWRVTQLGQAIMSTAIKLREEHFPHSFLHLAA